MLWRSLILAAAGVILLLFSLGTTSLAGQSTNVSPTITRGTDASACESACDGRFCGAFPCGIRTFYGTVLGDADCEPATNDACVCTVFECDPCGNGLKEVGEDCDFGGTCASGSAAGMACTFGQCGLGGQCQPRGGQGCAANCTNETLVNATVAPFPYSVNLAGRTIAISLTGPLALAEGKPRVPPIPPCLPAAILSFVAEPVSVPKLAVCVCALPRTR